MLISIGSCPSRVGECCRERRVLPRCTAGGDVGGTLDLVESRDWEPPREGEALPNILPAPRRVEFFPVLPLESDDEENDDLC